MCEAGGYLHSFVAIMYGRSPAPAVSSATARRALDSCSRQISDPTLGVVFGDLYAFTVDSSRTTSVELSVGILRLLLWLALVVKTTCCVAM